MPTNVLKEIEEDISWRTTEIKRIKLACNKLNKDERKFLLKSSVPLIYAHWEGFVSSSLKEVFKFLNS